MSKRLDGKTRTPNSRPNSKSKSDARQAERKEKALLLKQRGEELKILEHQVTSFALPT